MDHQRAADADGIEPLHARWELRLVGPRSTADQHGNEHHPGAQARETT
jgi:hypothetical protein